MRILWWLWDKSLWLTLPISVLFFSHVGLALLDFYKIESSVQITQQKYFSHYFYNRVYKSVYLLESKIHRKTLPKAQSHLELDVLYFTLQQSDLNALNQNLPQSGKEYKPSLLHVNGETHPIRLRYRGSNAKHWRDNKKSIRVKFVSEEKYGKLSEFDLLVPNDEAFLGAYLAHQLADDLSLYNPETRIVWVYINGEAMGLYLLQETISENTMLSYNRMPGDIYAGDIAEEDAFKGGKNTVFDNAYYWEKIAKNSDFPSKNRAPLQALIYLMKKPPGNERAIEQLIDYESFAKFYLFNYLVSSVNVDDLHNWRLYYDYNLARFYPIVWDAEGWQNIPDEEGAAHSLDDFLLRDPRFAEEIQKQWKQIKENKRLEDFVIRSQKELLELEPWLRAEPRFQQRLPDSIFDKPYEHTAKILKKIEQRFQGAPEIVNLDINPKIPKVKKLLEWKDEITIDGETHIHQPLSVYSGTRIRMMPNASLIFHNRVDIKGNSNYPIIIEQAIQDKPYGAIVFTEGASGSILKNCIVTGGSEYKNAIVQYPAMLAFSNVDNIVIDSCDIHGNHISDNMIHAVYSKLSIINSEIHHAFRDAIDTELSSIFIKNTKFHHNGNESIDTMASLVRIENSDIRFSGDNAISIGQKSYADIINSTIRNNVFAILAKDSSAVRIVDSVIESNDIGLRAYQRNNAYSEGGKYIIYGSKIINNESAGEIEKKSKLYALNSELPDEFFTQSKRFYIVTSDDPLRVLEQDTQVFGKVEKDWPFNIESVNE